MRSGLVKASWVAQELQRNLRVFDATWALPGSEFVVPDGRTAEEAYRARRIPGAFFWDLDEHSDPAASSAPHNLPSNEQFATAAALFGVEPTSRVVVYDQFGVFSSPKLWYAFRAFGLQDVAVLDGGLPAWLDAGFDVDSGELPELPSTPLRTWQLREGVQWRLPDVRRWLEDKKDRTLLDARSKPRFDGSVPDPRGNRSGHVPGSRNVPFRDLLAPPNTDSLLGATFADDDTLRAVFSAKPGDRVAVTCGSGLTAATLALGLHRLGVDDVALYDGSWAEYGAPDLDTPVATTPPDTE
mmetsp:Transcript_23596/g.72582  ORF Transcript_23596/g.72582 Transcript_23596/m.72582 type:complete len:298 (-) Transcript_23596:41-934(-)